MMFKLFIALVIIGDRFIFKPYNLIRIMPEKKSWTDENGKPVEFIPFFSTLYRDDESRRLDKFYDVSSCPDYPMSSTLGKTEHECFARNLLGVCKAVGFFVGFDKDELEKYDSYEGAFFPTSYLRLKKVRGIEVLFPTEELLKNQKVKEKN